MNGFEFMDSASYFVEISQVSLRVNHDVAGLELPLERLPGGKLTPACKERVITGLKGFLKRAAWQPRLRAWCAIGARGVLLRRVTIPPAGKNEFQQMLRLQIESEFPLAPEELAWGYLRLDETGRNGTEGRQELIVAAVKREVVVEYSEVLAECGMSPIFTLAALARSRLCPRSPGAYAVLEICGDHSELLTFDNGLPMALRILPWGEENLTELDSLTAGIKQNWSGQKLYLIGNRARQKETATRMAQGLGDGVECEPVEFMAGEGQSAAILGLKRATAKASGGQMLVLQIKEAKDRRVLAEPVLRKWVALAGGLLLGCLLFPYGEALLLKSYLSKKIVAARASRGTLATIDRELSLLQYLKQNQSPYLDAIYLMANAAPGGTRIDSLSMDRRGEISLRGNLRDLQQVVQFRSKLIESGFFSNVTVEEQTPTPDRQKVIVRMTAQWKPAGARAALKLGPSEEEMDKIKAVAKEGGSGGSPMMGPPFPMMPGNPSPMPGMGGPPPPSAPARVPPNAMISRTNLGAIPSGTPVILPANGETKQ